MILGHVVSCFLETIWLSKLGYPALLSRMTRSWYQHLQLTSHCFSVALFYFISKRLVSAAEHYCHVIGSNPVGILTPFLLLFPLTPLTVCYYLSGLLFFLSRAMLYFRIISFYLSLFFFHLGISRLYLREARFPRFMALVLLIINYRPHHGNVSRDRYCNKSTTNQSWCAERVTE